LIAVYFVTKRRQNCENKIQSNESKICFDRLVSFRSHAVVKAMISNAATKLRFDKYST